MNDLILNEQNLNAMIRMAEAMAGSNLLPTPYQRNPANLLVVLTMARELNIPPMQAINGINVIQGKPSVSPQLMLALIYNKYPNALIRISCNDKEQVVTVTMSRDKTDLENTTVHWSMQRAQQMGLTGKDNWKKQPMTMLKWRAVAEAARERFPDVIMGLYTVEEMAPDRLMTENGEPESQIIEAKIMPKTSIDKLRELVQARMKAGVSKEALLNVFKTIVSINSLKELGDLPDEKINELIIFINDQNNTFNN